MKKLTFLFLLIASGLLLGNKAAAQYTTAVGLKFGGYEYGVSGKYFFTGNDALEGVIGFRSHGMAFTGLYEISQTAFGVKELSFYYGAGGHLGALGSGTYRRYSSDDYEYHNSSLLLGVDGTVGLEYRFPDYPLAVSLDLNPRVELATGPFFDLAPGLGIKYVFK